MPSGMDEALKGEIVAPVVEGDKDKDSDIKGEEKDKSTATGIGESAEEKIRLAEESSQDANALIGQLGGLERTKEVITYLGSEEFKTLYSNKDKVSKQISGLDTEIDEKQKAVELIESMITKITNPLQSQITQLSSQSISRLSDVENTLTESNLTNALDRLSSKYPDLAEHREGIIKNAKELYPKGNFTESNIRSLYLLSKIDKGEISDGSKPKIDPDKIRPDLSNINIDKLKKSMSGKKSFRDIGAEIISQIG